MDPARVAGADDLPEVPEYPEALPGQAGVYLGRVVHADHAG